jgi:hypothetical protein
MADKKIEALAAKVNVLAESVAALATIVHSLQRSSPQPSPPPPPARWTERTVQAEIHSAKEIQGRTTMNMQPQHMEQVEGEITQPKRSLPNHTIVTNASSAIFSLNPSQHIPAHKNPSTRNPKRRTLRHCQNLNSSPSQALATLVKQGLLEPLETQSPHPPFGPNYDPTKHCVYHQISGHETDHCIRLQRDIQELIDQGVF